MERVLVPVDGSASAEHAEKHVIAMLKIGADAEIHLLHVQPPLVPRDVPDSPGSWNGSVSTKRIMRSPRQSDFWTRPACATARGPSLEIRHRRSRSMQTSMAAAKS